MAKVFERYKWLADLIQRSGGITLEDIQRAWDRFPLNDDHRYLSERTFHRHKEEIENAFNITIKCHKSSNKYYGHTFISMGLGSDPCRQCLIVDWANGTSNSFFVPMVFRKNHLLL